MGKITEQELIKSIKTNELKTVYMLYGPEKYMLEGSVRLLREKAVTGQALLNFTKLSGGKITPAEIRNETDTLPVMSLRRCVIVEDMPIDKLGKNQLKELNEMVADIPESTVLMFVFSSIQIDIKRSAAYRNFANLAAEHGDTVEFKYKTNSDLRKLLVKQAVKKGGRINKGGADTLIERIGTDLTSLLAELDKLVAYKGTDEINAEDVHLLTSKNLDSSAFDLAKVVLRNNYNEAFYLLDELFRQKQDELSILGAINMSFIDIYRAKCAQMAGKTEAVITSAYQYKGKEFRVRNAMRDCSRFSMSQIRGCIDILAEADTELKSSRVDKRTLLETAIGKMIVLGGKL